MEATPAEIPPLPLVASRIKEFPVEQRRADVTLLRRRAFPYFHLEPFSVIRKGRQIVRQK